jgi:DHA2 family multidrug resistance protein-like MFS transporter
MAVRTLPDTPKAKRSVDPFSVALNALALGLLIVGINGFGQRRDVVLSIAEIVAAAAIGVVFARRQQRQSAPLLPLDLLKRRIFALSLATSIASFAAQTLALVALPFYFEDTLGRSETMTGLLMTPWPVATAFIAPISGRLADRYAPGVLGSAGLLVLAAGLALLGLQLDGASTPSLVWRLSLCGTGFGFFQAPNNRLIVGSAPPERSGGAAGLQSVGRLIGQSFGAALVAVAFGRVPEHATAVAIWTAAALSLIGACASGLRRS